MSGGIAPSRSTVYVSNLVYSLTNNDLHKICSRYGQIVKVTLVRDKESRKSKGIAFVQYLKRDDALQCVKALDGKRMFDRTIKCSIAKDNGRSTEFIKRKYYPDKSSCYECGDSGHLSYACPKNSLGRRTPPPKKEKRKKLAPENLKQEEDSDSDDEAGGEPDFETLSAAIKLEQAKMGTYDHSKTAESSKRKVIKKSAYFSDEEDLSD